MSMRSCEPCPYHLSSLSTAQEKRHRVWYVPVAPLVFEMESFLEKSTSGARVTPVPTFLLSLCHTLALANRNVGTLHRFLSSL